MKKLKENENHNFVNEIKYWLMRIKLIMKKKTDLNCEMKRI